jgi:hypothetical protein
VRQEKDHLGMGTEGMIRAKFLKLVFDERRDPIPIALINLPGEPDEGHEVLLIFCFFNLEFLFCHAIDLR